MPPPPGRRHVGTGAMMTTDMVIVVVLSLAMTMSLYRVLAGPTIYDRLAGLSLMGTKSIVLLLLLGLLTQQVDAFVDLALTYSLILFVGTVVVAKYFEGTEAPR